MLWIQLPSWERYLLVALAAECSCLQSVSVIVLHNGVTLFAMVSSKLFIALAVVCGRRVKTAALHQSRDGTKMRSSTDLCGQL